MTPKPEEQDVGQVPASSASGGPSSEPHYRCFTRPQEAEATACGLLMLRLGRAVAARMSAALGAVHMNPHEYAVLHALSEGGGVSQAELAATLRVHPSNLVAILDGLEGEGLIERQRDTSDRRRQLLALAPAGAERLNDARAAVEEAEQSLLAPLESSDRRRLHAYLERLAAHTCVRVAKGRKC